MGKPSWRQRDAALETALRKLEAMDMRIAQFSRQRPLSADDEHAVGDDRLDVFRIHTGQRHEDQEFVVGLDARSWDLALSTEIGQKPITARTLRLRTSARENFQGSSLGNPSKAKRDVSKPLNTKAISNADAPGSTSMATVSSMAARTRRKPGSLIAGIPASLTTTTCLPW